MTSQMIGIGLGVLLLGGILYLFVRKGLKITPDPSRNPPSEHT